MRALSYSLRTGILGPVADADRTHYLASSSGMMKDIRVEEVFPWMRPIMAPSREAAMDAYLRSQIDDG